jgi:hypothetical protein
MSNLGHACLTSLEAIDGEREVQRFLYLPNGIVFAGGKHLRWISDGYPADRKDGSRCEPCLDMNNAIDPDLRSRPDVRAMEDGTARSEKDFLLDHAADDMSIGADKAVSGDAQPMGRRATQNGVLHDDALAAYLDGAALRDDLCAEHDSRASADGDVPAYDGVRSNEGRGINDGRLAQVFDEHGAMVEQPCFLRCLTFEFTRLLQRAKPAVAIRVQRRVRQRRAASLHR